MHVVLSNQKWELFWMDNNNDNDDSDGNDNDSNDNNDNNNWYLNRLALLEKIMHRSFATPAPPPPSFHSGLSGGLGGLSPQINSMLVLR